MKSQRCRRRVEVSSFVWCRYSPTRQERITEARETGEVGRERTKNQRNKMGKGGKNSMKREKRGGESDDSSRKVSLSKWHVMEDVEMADMFFPHGGHTGAVGCEGRQEG